MTYLTFLLVFLLPPIVTLAALQRRPLAGVGGARGWYTLPLICVIAFAYTTPWDNYLVYRGIWGYGADRVLGVIGYVPLEEYAFFLLQPILTGLFLYVLFARKPSPIETNYQKTMRWGNAIYGLCTLLGVILLISGWESGLYLGLILAWASPVLLAMWLYAGPFFMRYRRAFRLAVAAPTLYLWIADRIAIGLGIWDISNQFTLDFDPLGLPVEEAVFFLVTNLLVVQGAMLFLFGDKIAEARQEHRATQTLLARSEDA